MRLPLLEFVLGVHVRALSGCVTRIKGWYGGSALKQQNKNNMQENEATG